MFDVVDDIWYRVHDASSGIKNCVGFEYWKHTSSTIRSNREIIKEIGKSS